MFNTFHFTFDLNMVKDMETTEADEQSFLENAGTQSAFTIESHRGLKTLTMSQHASCESVLTDCRLNFTMCYALSLKCVVFFFFFAC